MANNNSEKGIGLGKIISIILMVFILMPILILGVIYFTNDGAKVEMNKYLSLLPGSFGEHFKAYPTKSELNENIQKIARYLIEIDNERAIDKLLLIKKEDEGLYSDVIKVMLQLDPRKTQNIVNSIRQSTVKEDIIINTISQIDEERKNKLEEKAQLFENLSTISAINKINYQIDNQEISFMELGNIFESMDSKVASQLLYYLNNNSKSSILKNIESENKTQELERLISEIEDNKTRLNNIAQIYSTEAPDKLVPIIGNAETYKLDELATIYRNIDILKSARILSSISDDSFVFDLINSIKEQEILVNGNDNLTDDLIKALKIYRNFESNVKNLTAIYEKMDDAQIAELVTKLIVDSQSNKKYVLDSGQTIVLTDEDLAISVLNNFSDRKLANILTNLDNNLSSEISKKITYPTP